MSKFFKALQQAEQERALRGSPEGKRQSVGAEVSPVPRGSDDPRVSGWDLRTGDNRNGTTIEGPPAGRTSFSIEDVDQHLVSLLMPSSFEAEQYRMLSHAVERFGESGSAKVIAITSPSGGDGKTMTAINLAGALAHGGRNRVLLLEADLRRPMVATCLGLPDSDGGIVEAVARSEAPLAHIVTRLAGADFDVLTAGHPSATPDAVLRSPRAQEIFREARRVYDHVLVDTPPLVAIPECRVIEQLVDGFLVLVRAHWTRRNLLAEALGSVDPTKVLGLVFNGDDAPGLGYGRYYRYRARKRPGNGRGERRER